MDIAIVGAHGQVARHLTRLLAARGDAVRGLIRNADHIADLETDGAAPVVIDIENATAADLAQAIAGADAVVFAAGAGAGSSAARKWTVDRDGATKLIDAAKAAGVTRYVMVSAVGAEAPPAPDDDDVFNVYLRAKAEADEALIATDLEWTVVRPGRLTDDEPRDRVSIQVEPRRGEVPRADVAAAVAAVLHEPRSIGSILYVNDGEDTVADGLAAALG